MHHPDVLHDLARAELADRLHLAEQSKLAADGRRRYRSRRNRGFPGV